MSFLVLAKCCALADTFSYLELGNITFGRWFGLVLQLCVGFYAFGSCTSQ